MKSLVIVSVLAFLSATAFGQKVKLSGEWKLNEQKSELGDQFSLAPKALTIVQTKKTLDITTVSEFDGQEVEGTSHYTLDGEKCENVGFMESTTISTALLDKKAKNITIVTNGSVQEMDYTLTQIIALDEGNLVVESEASSDMGEMMETFVFDKK